MTTVFNCNQKLSSHRLLIFNWSCSGMTLQKKNQSYSLCIMNCIRPTGRVQHWNTGFCLFKPDTLTHVITQSKSLHDKIPFVSQSMQMTVNVQYWNAWDGSIKLLPKFSHSFDKYACAIFSARLFYKMRLIRSRRSQGEFGWTNHLYTTSSKRLVQPTYINALHGVHVNSSCNFHESYALGNSRMSSQSRPQSITRNKTPIT